MQIHSDETLNEKGLVTRSRPEKRAEANARNFHARGPEIAKLCAVRCAAGSLRLAPRVPYSWGRPSGPAARLHGPSSSPPATRGAQRVSRRTDDDFRDDFFFFLSQQKHRWGEKKKKTPSASECVCTAVRYLFSHSCPWSLTRFLRGRLPARPPLTCGDPCLCCGLRKQVTQITRRSCQAGSSRSSCSGLRLIETQIQQTQIPWPRDKRPACLHCQWGQ